MRGLTNMRPSGFREDSGRGREDAVGTAADGARRALTPHVIDILFVLGIVAAFALIALLGRGVERL